MLNNNLLVFTLLFHDFYRRTKRMEHARLIRYIYEYICILYIYTVSDYGDDTELIESY